VEGHCGGRRGRAGTFSRCSARSRSTERKVETPRLCSSLLFYSILFPSFLLKSSVTCFAPRPTAQPYLLTFSIPRAVGAVSERRSLEAEGDGLQPPRKQLQQLEGLLATVLPVGRTGTCRHLGGSPRHPEPTGANPLPSAARAPAARGRGAAPRGGRHCVPSGVWSPADICSVDVSQSLISRLFVISLALL